MYYTLKFVYGCMGSGKTLQLINFFRKKRLIQRPREILILKPSVDTRCDEYMVLSSTGEKEKCEMIQSDANIIQSFSSRGIPEYILVDEAQFLTRKQVRQLREMVSNNNINVICYGLRTDFKGNLFEGSQALFEMADQIEEIKSLCFCGNNAILHLRLVKDFLNETKQIKDKNKPVYVVERVGPSIAIGKPVIRNSKGFIIDDEVKYASVCFTHWLKGICRPFDQALIEKLEGYDVTEI